MIRNKGITSAVLEKKIKGGERRVGKRQLSDISRIITQTNSITSYIWVRSTEKLWNNLISIGGFFLRLLVATGGYDFITKCNKNLCGLLY